MGRPRTKGMVEAREAVVVIVGAKAAVYDQVEVTHNKTGQRVMINKDYPREEAVEGMPYAFKPGEKVRRDHPAVGACPGAFREIDSEEVAVA